MRLEFLTANDIMPVIIPAFSIVGKYLLSKIKSWMDKGFIPLSR